MSDYLASWRGETRDRITAFVEAVTDPEGADYVDPGDRIATFDNDGTLWVEKPAYTQLVFLIERLGKVVNTHPEWETLLPYYQTLQSDPPKLSELTIQEILQLTAATHTGMTQREFMAITHEFLERALHPRFGRLYTQLVYQPMLELIDFLHAHEFKVYICSAGGLDFVRSFSEHIYGIPSERVMGSSIRKRFEETDDGIELRRLPELVQPINDGPNKAELIERHVGKRPILAAGNANGDLQMLQYAASHEYRSLSILICHDDAQREYDYVAGAEKVRAIAEEKGWLQVSMKSEFKVLFP